MQGLAPAHYHSNSNYILHTHYCVVNYYHAYSRYATHSIITIIGVPRGN